MPRRAIRATLTLWATTFMLEYAYSGSGYDKDGFEQLTTLLRTNGQAEGPDRCQVLGPLPGGDYLAAPAAPVLAIVAAS